MSYLTQLLESRSLESDTPINSTTLGAILGGYTATTGKSVNDGTWVATPAVPVPGAAVGAWMCAMVVVPDNPLNDAWTRIVFNASSQSTWTDPLPVPPVSDASSG